MAEPRVYWIRRVGDDEPITNMVFTDLVLALDYARKVALQHAVRVEIVRENGSVAIAVDPEGFLQERGP